MVYSNMQQPTFALIYFEMVFSSIFSSAIVQAARFQMISGTVKLPDNKTYDLDEEPKDVKVEGPWIHFIAGLVGQELDPTI